VGTVAEAIAEIPDRELFKAADVCEIASVQPYVLRSWESEFPTLGFARSPGTPRVYRRDDVERVLRIKQLVYGEGLTLAGARRRLDGDAVTTDDQKPVVLVADARRKLNGIRGELRSLLEMLGGPLVHAAKPRKATGAGQPTLLGIDAEVVSGRKAPAETLQSVSAPAAKTPAWTSPAGKTPDAVEGEKVRAARRKA
jgi:DNA-binding transcriptional MerR regulator